MKTSRIKVALLAFFILAALSGCSALAGNAPAPADKLVPLNPKDWPTPARANGSADADTVSACHAGAGCRTGQSGCAGTRRDDSGDTRRRLAFFDRGSHSQR